MMVKRFMSMLITAGAILLPGGSGVCSAADSGSEIYLDQSEGKKKKKKKKKKTYINIQALHESLPGSKLVDSGLLLFELNGCEVYVLADENAEVRFMLVRLLKTDTKLRKKDTMLKDVCQRLHSNYGRPEWAGQLNDEEGKTALLYFAPPEYYDAEADKTALGCDRVTALYDVINYYTEEDKAPELALSPGYSVAFLVAADELQFNMALDISQPTVEYAEVRYVKQLKKSLTAKYPQTASSLWPGLHFSGKKGSVDGKTNFKILGTDDSFWMGRKEALFIFSTEERLRAAAVKGVNVKKCGFEREDFSELSVDMPSTISEEDWVKLTQAPGEEEPEEEYEEEPEVETPTPKPEPKPEVQPEPAPEKSTPEPAPQPAAPAEPHTPESARRAFIDQLRNL